MEKIVLIDGHSILNRAFYGLPDLTNQEGLHTNAVYGFLNIMFKILEEEKPQYLTVAFDLSEPTFRHKMYAEYKGTRKPMPAELREQVPLIKEVLKAMKVNVVTKGGFEADDILGTIATKCEKNGIVSRIVSGDRDLLQVATDNIMIRIPKTKKGVTEIENYNTKDVIEAYGVTPKEFIDVKALMGDASDNIPGVPGIGEKTAQAIIKQFHSIENAYAHIDEITPTKAKNNLSEYYDKAEFSKVLATINLDAPIEFDLKDATFENMFNEESYNMFLRLNFKSFLKQFEEKKSDNNIDFDSKINVIDTFNDAVLVLKNAFNNEFFGMDICHDENYGVCGIGVCDKDTINYICVNADSTGDKLKNEILRLIDENDTTVSFVDLKDALHFLDIEESKKLADVSIMEYLLNPTKGSYPYDYLALDLLSMEVPTKSEIMGKEKLSEAYFMNPEKLSKLSGIRAYVANKTYAKLKDSLVKSDMLKLYTDVEIPLVYVLREMERNGIAIDTEALLEYGKMLKSRISVLEDDIYTEAGTTFNINSPKQLGEILFEQMGMPGGKKTKTGYSTSADVLEKLSVDYPFVNHILEYRQLTKLNSTYVDGMIPFVREDGRIHGTFNQTITATGRLSSTEPNLQNIPIRIELGKQIRKVFVPAKNYVFIDSDYSQIELRLMAHLSNDEKLIEAYNSDADIHRITASQVFNTPLEEVTKAQRSNAKAVNFGIIYGISSFGLSQDLSISRAEAKDYIEKYFATYPQVKKYLDNTISQAKETGYAVTLFNRRRPIPELKNSNFMQRQFGERIAMNSPVQGSAADIIKLAMIGVYRELKFRKLKSKLILQVHDELLIETAEDEIEIVKELVNRNMTNACKLSVPLIVDTNVGKDWLEAH